MKKILLNGTWQFTKDDAFNDASWETVLVPHTWNNMDGQDGGNDYYRGLCYYKRVLNIEPHNGRLFLEFEGVNSIGTVYLNGTELGTHKGGYSTFRYDITDVAKEGDNDLLVGVDNAHYEDVMPLMADFTFYGGIYRDSFLIYTPATGFDLSHFGTKGVYVSQTNISDDKAEYQVDAYINNYSVPQSIVVVNKLKDSNGTLIQEEQQEHIIDEKGLVSFTSELANPHLWNGVQDPYLYTVEVELLIDGVVIDNRSIPTGFRYFHFDENAFYLNGKQLRLNGVSRHQDRKDVGNALTKEMHKQDIAFIKEIGANSIRLAHYQQAQYFYDLCDQEGFVVWAEIPYITRPSKTDHEGTNPLQQMEELVKQNYNHSSIVMWGVQNETTAVGKRDNLENIVQKLHNLTKEIDPYRVTTQAQVAMHPLKDSMNGITDVLGFNQYFGWYHGEVEDFGPWLDEYRKLNPTRPLCLSEYGVEGIVRYHTDDPKCKDYTEEYHALWHEKAYSIMSSKDFVWGTYVWNMFTFAADFRDEGGVKGLNNKGLVNFDRTIRKDAFYYYKAKWSTEPVLHLTSKRFVERHNKEITIKAYSNQDNVTFYLNGEPVAITSQNDVVFTANVTLQDGENIVTVSSEELSDQTTFITVEQENPQYSVPQADQGKGIFTIAADNWIDTEFAKTEELTINPEFFSVEDSIESIMNNPKTGPIFDKYFEDLKKHPMFEMTKGFSIKMIHEFDKQSLPMTFLIIVNKALQKVKK